MDSWPCGYNLSSLTVSVLLWLRCSRLYVPVTCRDIKSDPILLVFVVNATRHANNALACCCRPDHKMAIMCRFL